MTLQEILNEIEKPETEIIKPHSDNILYEPSNTLAAYVYVLNHIIPHNPALVELYAEIEITDQRIIAEYLSETVKKLKGNS